MESRSNRVSGGALGLVEMGCSLEHRTMIDRFSNGRALPVTVLNETL